MSVPVGRTVLAEATPPRRWLRRFLFLTSVVMSATVFVTAIGGYAVVTWFNGSVARVHLDLGQKRPAPAPAGSENWLLAGLDSRAGTDGEYGDVAGERSDTTILTHVDADGITTNMSIPRDTLVTIPAYTDAQGHQHPAHMDKFNAAISLGGPSLMVRTVELLTGIRIDHYVGVDLEGFKQISDAIGGVQVCLLPSSYVETTTEAGITHTSTNLDDSYSGFHGVVGEQTISGDQALAFVRQRHGLVNGDIGRIQRQQQFLGAVFRKATSSDVLFNPVRFAELLSAFTSALTLDQNTSITDLEHLALRLRALNPADLRFETLPQRSLESTDTDLGDVFTDSDGILEIIPNGQTQSVGSVQIIEQPAFQAMLEGLKDTPKKRPASVGPASSGASPTTPATPTPTPTPSASASAPVDAASPSNRCTY